MLIPTVEGDREPSTQVIDASHMVMLTPHATFLDRAKRSVVPPSKKALRFSLHLGSSEPIDIVKDFGTIDSRCRYSAAAAQHRSR